MSNRRPTRERPKSRPRNATAPPRIGVAVMLTKTEIQKLKALAASDLRSVPNYAVWLVASDLEAAAQTRSSRRGGRAAHRSPRPIHDKPVGVAGATEADPAADRGRDAVGVGVRGAGDRGGAGSEVVIRDLTAGTDS